MQFSKIDQETAIQFWKFTRILLSAHTLNLSDEADETCILMNESNESSICLSDGTV